MSSIWLERRAPDFGGLPRVVSHLHNPGDFSPSFSWVVFGALDIESRRGRAGRIANRICYVRVPRFSFNIVASHFEVRGLCSVLSRREQPWLLKNSLSRNPQKLDRVRMPYKRFSLVAWTFSIPQICPDFCNLFFFYTHNIF